MTLLIQNLLILGRLTIALQENLPPEATRNDPLIAHGWQTWQYVGIAALAVGAIAIVRMFSLRVEHAILLAVVISVIVIALFMGR